ncbi:MAG: hypothetical protein IPP52_12910 [Ignavibacteria bacterium]|nr:hypothetical protein [Ignavibacteria bacterium]
MSAIFISIVVILNNSISPAQYESNSMKLTMNDKLKKNNLYKEDTDSDSTKNFGKYTPNAGV